MPQEDLTTHERTDGRPSPRGRMKRVWFLFAAVTLVALAIDLGSKEAAFRLLADQPVEIDREQVLAKIRAGVPLNHLGPLEEVRRAGAPEEVWQPVLPDHSPTVVIPHVFEFKLVLNAGAVFGSGQGKRWLFIGFTVVALGFCVYLVAVWTRPGEWWTQSAVGLVAAGGLGNLYDRLMYGCVRDFLHPLPGVEWPFGWTVFGNREVWPYVSNVADAFLLIGIGVLVISMWQVHETEEQDEVGECGDGGGDGQCGDGGAGAGVSHASGDGGGSKPADGG